MAQQAGVPDSGSFLSTAIFSAQLSEGLLVAMETGRRSCSRSQISAPVMEGLEHRAEGGSEGRHWAGKGGVGSTRLGRRVWGSIWILGVLEAQGLEGECGEHLATGGAGSMGLGRGSTRSTQLLELGRGARGASGYWVRGLSHCQQATGKQQRHREVGGLVEKGAEKGRREGTSEESGTGFRPGEEAKCSAVRTREGGSQTSKWWFGGNTVVIRGQPATPSPVYCR